MNLTAELVKHREETSGLSRQEQVNRSCELARHFEKLGEYEAACEAIFEFWPNRDAELRLDGVDDETSAQALLRAGSLAGRVGSADQTEGSQEAAKNLITQSLELFEKLGNTK